MDIFRLVNFTFQGILRPLNIKTAVRGRGDQVVYGHVRKNFFYAFPYIIRFCIAISTTPHCGIFSLRTKSLQVSLLLRHPAHAICRHVQGGFDEVTCSVADPDLVFLGHPDPDPGKNPIRILYLHVKTPVIIFSHYIKLS